MFDALYDLIYNAVFAGATNVAPALAQEICSWASTAGCLALIAVPFVMVIGCIKLILRLL